MTDYITITINQQFLESFTYFLIYGLAILVLVWIITFMLNEIERTKERKEEIECEPYYKKWMKLQEEKKFDEASKFYKKYKDKIQKVSYY